MWSTIGWITLIWAGCALGWVIFFNVLGISFRLRHEPLGNSVPLCRPGFQNADAGAGSHPISTEPPPGT